MLGQARGEPTGARNVAGQRSQLIEAAENDVIDLSRIHAGTFDERADRVRAEIRSMHRREAALFPAGRSAHRADDVSLAADQWVLTSPCPCPWGVHYKQRSELRKRSTLSAGARASRDPWARRLRRRGSAALRGCCTAAPPRRGGSRCPPPRRRPRAQPPCPTRWWAPGAGTHPPRPRRPCRI